jgi:hypothetical protein
VNFARFSQWKAQIDDASQAGVEALHHKTAALAVSLEEARATLEAAQAKSKKDQTVRP